MKKDTTERLEELYIKYLTTYKSLQEQNFSRGSSILTDIVLTMKEIEGLLREFRAFDDDLAKLKREILEKSEFYREQEYMFQ